MRIFLKPGAPALLGRTFICKADRGNTELVTRIAIIAIKRQVTEWRYHIGNV